MAKRKPASDLPRTVAEFEAWHARQPERWEFIAGATVMMAPGSLPHTIIKGNVFAALRAKLAGSPCRAFVDGAQVRGRRLSAIPDVDVACASIDLASPTIAEPMVIVEVLSPYSERDDTLRKWQGYCLIPSLQHYLVVAQDSRFVTLHTRTGAASFEERVFQDGVIELGSLRVSLSLDEIYEGIEFEPGAENG
jgi:Uma2 family endonuclease